MYRPRSRSRSPPPYRSRQYSPSQPLPRSRSRSPPPPPRRYHQSDSPPPSGRRYDYPSGSGSRRYEDDYLPPGRPRYDEGYRSPPPRRFDDRDDPYGYRSRRSPPPPPRDTALQDLHAFEREFDREYARDRYSPPRASSMRDAVPPSGPSRGMMSDRDEYYPRERAPPSGPRVQDQRWERGRDPEEMEYEDMAGSTGNRRGPKQPSAPSRDVIFLGLDPQLSETDFAGYLKTEHQAQISSVKIVLDKVTGQSKCFGFAAFVTLTDAEEFIANNYPAVVMPALYEHSEPRKVKIDFSATLTGSNAPEGSSAHGGVTHARPAHDGMRDIGVPGGGNRVLLLRGLNYYSSPEEISYRLGEEIARLVGQSGRNREAQKAIARIVMVIDRSARSSWGYCFVEFVTAELATAMLSFLISPQSQPQGFQIRDFAVAASFANPSAFVPTPAGPLGGELVVRASRNGGVGGTTIDQTDGAWVGYWHPEALPHAFTPSGSPCIDDKGNLQALPSDLRSFLGVYGGGSADGSSTNKASQQAHVPAPTGPVSISMTAMQPIKAVSVGKRKTPEDGFVSKDQKNALGEEEESDLIGKDTVLLSRTKGIANIIGPSTRKIAKNISKWNNKKTELSVPPPDERASGRDGAPRGLSEANSALGSGNRAVQAPGKNAAASSSSPVATFDYSDISGLATTGKVACLLCQRQFKTEEDLKKHTARSELHKTNLLDSSICEAGRQRKATADAKASSSTDLLDQPRYRDRAAERREVHHQPDKPLPGEMPNQPIKRKFAEGPKPPPPPPAPALEPGKDESNRGNQLLAKMGWKTGVGLGTGGDGRVDPIMVQQFENRAGLGASKGHEAGKYQGTGGFQARAKDMTKERFEQLSKQ